MELPAEDFIDRTGFIPPEDQADLEKGRPIQYEASVFATLVMDEPMDFFVGVALMRQSDKDTIASLIDWSGDEPTIETDDLREHSIPTTLVNNGEDNDGNKIVNVSQEQFNRLSPGKRVKVEVRQTEDEDGQQYLNGSVIEVLDDERDVVEMELEDFEQKAKAPEA